MIARFLRSAGLRELGLLAVLYIGYSAIRTIASDDFAAAKVTAERILHVERWFGLDWEHGLNALFHDHRWLEVGGSFYYAAAHYLVTPAVLLWLWTRRREAYRPARSAFVLATIAALGLFLLLPTAPPRLVGYHDALALTSDVGWWSTSASAPAGMGHLTNQLAAMPSMHVGWALWCAMVLWTYAATRTVRLLGVAHAVLTCVVVVGTGNHWTLDLLVGGGLMVVAWLALVPSRRVQSSRVPLAHAAPHATAGTETGAGTEAEAGAGAGLTQRSPVPPSA